MRTITPPPPPSHQRVNTNFLILLTLLFCHSKLYSGEIVNLDYYKDANGWYTNFTGVGVTLYASNFFDDYNEQLGLRDNDKMILVFPDDGNLEADQLKFKQYYKDIEVENSYFIFHQKNGVVKEFHPHIVTSLDIDVSNSLTEDEARDIAISSINVEEYAWENVDYENGLKVQTGYENATYYPAGKLLIGQVNGAEMDKANYVFAWKFEIFTTQPIGMHILYIDAVYGSVLAGCNPNGVDFFPPIRLDNYTLQTNLSDEFSGVYNPNVWEFWTTGGSCWGPNDFDQSFPDPNNLSYPSVLTNSGTEKIMRITTKKLQTPIVYNCDTYGWRSFDYSSAVINSKDFYLYGYYEIKCKYPAILAEVSQDFWFWWGFDYRSEDRYTEIDVFEHYSKHHNWQPPQSTNTRYFTNIHAGYGTDYLHPGIDTSWCRNGSEYHPDMCMDLMSDFHTYGVDWTPTSITYYFDGRPLYDASTPDKTHTVINACNDRTWPISELRAVKAVINQTVRHDSSLPPSDGEIINFDVDYFRYYKRKPDIIGPETVCQNSTAVFTAKMFGVSTTSDTYHWSVSQGASIIGANTGNTCTIQFGSQSNVTLTLTATETTTGYVDHSTNTPIDYLYPRESIRIKNIWVGSHQPSQLLLVNIVNRWCEKQVAAIEEPDMDAYWFSDDGGSTWKEGNHGTLMINGNLTNVQFHRWGYQPRPSSYTVKCRTETCGSYSGITSYTFNYPVDPLNTCLHKMRNPNIDTFIDYPFDIIPNPSSQTSQIRYLTEVEGVVSITITDLMGKELIYLVNNDYQNAGLHQLNINTSAISEGIFVQSIGR